MALTGKQKHYVRVGQAVDNKYNSGSAYSIAAWFHDYIEDGLVEEGDLEDAIRHTFPVAKEKDVRKAKEAIILLTRKKEMTYRNYIKELCKNKIARTVKLYDLHDNMYGTIFPPPGDLKKRYEWAINYITSYSERWSFPLLMIGLFLGSTTIVAGIVYLIYKYFV